MVERLAHWVLDDEINRKQSVFQHCLNAANYTNKSESSKILSVQSITFLSALLHDVGKATNAFSDYLEKAVKEGKRDKKVNHSSAGAKFLSKYFHGDEEKVINLLKTIISETIVSHHGLNDFISPNGDNQFEKRCIPKNDIQFEQVEEYITSNYDMDKLQELFRDSVKELSNLRHTILNYAKAETDSKTVYHFYFSCLVRYILSIVIDADREDTRAFELDISTHTYQESSTIWSNGILALENHLETLHTNKQSLSKIRERISDECKNAAEHEPGIYRLSCPTGSGKTLASLRFALYHAKKYNKRHIIYVAPYKTILEQNATVMKQFFSEEDVLEHHSNIIPEDARVYSYLNSNWSTPVILTTAVQFYQTLFSDSTTSIRRFHQLTDSIIIIDEAQTLPVHMIHMFNTMMNFMSELGKSTVMLCTATQPTFDKVRYPLHYANNTEIVQNVSDIQEAFKRVHVVDACTTSGFDEDEYHDFIMSCWKKHKKVLVIVNTKLEASTLYKKCSENDLVAQNNIKLFHLTTNMYPEHRSECLINLIKNLDDESDNIICIATNLIECGVDISFHCVIRSLTSLDSIVQAAGRCNRNKVFDFGYLYLVNSGFESINKLPTVRCGKKIVHQLLKELKKENEEYVDQLFSQQYIEKYYHKYYFDEKDNMDYSIKELQTTQMELWTIRKEAVAEALKMEYQVMPTLYSALKTAGENFEPIDRTIGILVEHGKGKEIADCLRSGAKNEVKYLKLKEAQRYTIQAYENTVQRLIDKGIVSMIEFGRVLCLNENYYNDAIGLNIASEMDVLTV